MAVTLDSTTRTRASPARNRFDQALIVEQDRQGRPRNRRHRIKHAQRRAKREADQPCRANGPPLARRLKQDQRQDDDVGDELDPAGLNAARQRRDGDAGQQADDNGNTFLHIAGTPFRLMIRDVEVDEHFDQNDGGIEDSICVEDDASGTVSEEKP